MKVYKVVGYHYDSFYEGNTYASRELAEQEAAILNKLHQEYELWRHVEDTIDHEAYADHERIQLETNDPCDHYQYNRNHGYSWQTYEHTSLFSVVKDRWERKYSFIYHDFDASCRDIANMYVHVTEREILEALPAKLRPTTVDIHNAVINAFKGDPSE